MDRYVVLFGSACESERVPLEVGNFGAGQEDVLASAGGSLFLLDLELHHVGRVLNDLVDVRAVPRTDFAEDALENPDDATNQPVALVMETVVSSCYSFESDGSRTQKTPMVLKEQ